MKTTTAVFLVMLCASTVAQGPQSDRQQFIRFDSDVVALTHARIVDGTGAPPLEDQTWEFSSQSPQPSSLDVIV